MSTAALELMILEVEDLALTKLIQTLTDIASCLTWVCSTTGTEQLVTVLHEDNDSYSARIKQLVTFT